MKKCSVEGCDRHHHAHGFCGMHAQRFRRYARTDFAQRTFTREYFESCLQKQHDGCWIWDRVVLSTGYGQFFSKLAHRVAYEFYIGKIPDGKLVLHRCDVRKCVNPEHLVIGTHQENNDDMMRKGRHRVTHHKSTKHSSMLSADQVNKIRKLHKDGATIESIACEFKRHRKTISSIVRGIRYVMTTTT